MFHSGLKSYLSKSNAFTRNIFILVTAFCTYFCAYGFRKPFTASTFQYDLTAYGLGQLDYKILLIIAQVLGYTLAKFWGIKIISEVKKDADVLVKYIIFLLSIAGLSWVFLALVPPPYNVIFIFINGFPLGLIWGLVFSFLEGRKHTEVLGTGLSASFIFAAAFSLQIGQFVLDWGISEYWMPFYVCLIYYVPMLLAVWLLGHSPPPSKEDEALRTHREPMDREARRRFMKTFLWGVVALTISYMMLNALREMRSNFAKEIIGDISQFTQSETLISIIILVFLSLYYRIKDNARALKLTLITILFGSLLAGGATLAFQLQWIDAWLWMFAIGLGTYLGYIPMAAFVFDRLLAATHWIGTMGFLVYLIDAFAYVATISLLLTKTFSGQDLEWLSFAQSFCYLLAIVNGVLLVYAIFYFDRKIKMINK